MYKYQLFVLFLVFLVLCLGLDNALAQDRADVAVQSHDAEGPIIVGSSFDMPAGNCDTLRYLGTIPAYPTVSFGHASATLGDTLYIVGGSASGAASTTVATYHIPSATWGSGPPLPEAKTGGDLVACGGSLYYMGGGSTVTTPTATCYRYDPASGWTSIANMPTPVSGHVAESWGDSVIFVTAGGWASYLTIVQVYRPGSDSWSTSTSLPAGRGRRSFAGGLWGNKIFVAAGFSGAFRKDFVIGTIVRADSIIWTIGPDVPMRSGATGSSRPGGHAVDGRFYFVAGETSPAPGPQDSIFIWDINAAQWLPTIITGRGSQAASNYWGVVSSSRIGGGVQVWIPGGALGTVSTTGLWVIDACPSSPPGPQVFTRRPNRPIPDNDPNGIRDTITTPAISNIVKVQVVLDTVLHTYVGDFTMNLTSPRGERIWLMFRPGSGTFGSSGDNFIRTVFDDTATYQIENILSTGSPPLGPPYTGYFRPDSAGAVRSLSVFNGNQPAGNWILHVADNAQADLGTLVRWSIIIHTGTVGVEEVAGIPERFELSQNYPNPFNPTTTIRYSLPRPEFVTIKVFDILGREVAKVIDGFQQLGSHEVVWNASPFASGVYFYRMQAGTFIQTRKLMILK